MSDLPDDIRRALLGDDDTAGELGTSDLMARVYDELHAMADRIMQGERGAHTLQPTALVHEAFLRLTGSHEVGKQGRLHFLRAAAVTMRRVLVDHARARNAGKRGGAWERVTLQGVDVAGASGDAEDVDLVLLNELLEELEELDPRQARIVELRFFGDLTGAEIAELLDVSRQTVVRELTMARAWLRHRLDGA